MPYAFIKLIGGVIACFVLAYIGIDAFTTDWVETYSISKELGAIESEQNDDILSYFYFINYSYYVEDKLYRLKQKYTYNLLENAQLGLEVKSKNPESLSIFYNRGNPEIAHLQKPADGWVYFFTTFGLLAYMRYVVWYMVKYYELEIEQVDPK